MYACIEYSFCIKNLTVGDTDCIGINNPVNNNNNYTGQQFNIYVSQQPEIFDSKQAFLMRNQFEISQ